MSKHKLSQFTWLKGKYYKKYTGFLYLMKALKAHSTFKTLKNK